MKPTPEQEAVMRKVAFQVGFTRYLHLNQEDPALVGALSGKGLVSKTGSDAIEKVLTMSLLGVPVLSYLSGRYLGRAAGGLYGNAVSPSAASFAEREYDLAGEAAQRSIDDLNTDTINKDVSEAIEAAKPKPKQNPFATPSLLRYGR